MATQSVPGTVIPIGAAISPAGGFGAQGPTGPTGPQGAAPPLADTSHAGSVNVLSGNATDYIGGDNACHPRIASTNEYYDQDDFLCVGAGAANIWNSKLCTMTNSGGTGALSSAATLNWPAHPGVVQLAPGTTASSWSRIQSNGTYLYLDGNITIKIQGVFGVATGSFAGTNQYWFGLCTPAAMGPVLTVSNYYIGFFAAPNNAPSATNWLYYSRNASTAVTQVDSGVAVGSIMTWHKFTIQATAGQIQFWIDDNLIATVTDNSIPVGTQALIPCFFTNNGTGTNNFSMLVDSFDILLQPVVQSGQPSTRFMRQII